MAPTKGLIILYRGWINRVINDRCFSGRGSDADVGLEGVGHFSEGSLSLGASYQGWVSEIRSATAGLHAPEQ